MRNGFAMRYVCLNCAERFEHDATVDAEGDDEKKKKRKKIRCPKCMRVTGIEPFVEKAPPDQGNQRVLLAVVALVVAAAAGGYAMWRGRSDATVEGDAPLAPLAADQLRGYARLAHADVTTVVSLLEPGDAITELAREAAQGAGGAVAQGEAIHAAIRARAAAQAFMPWSLGVPRETPPADARAVLGWISEDGARRRLYPLEAAALEVAAMRSRGLAAMVAEIWEFPGDRTPPDASGHFGYFGVALYDGEAGEGDPTRIFDPWRGRETQPASGDYRVLTDVEALGAALNLRALHMLSREAEPERAVELAQGASRLHPRSPSVRAVLGAILLSAGGPEALRELEAAAEIRRDGPRLNLLASVHMAQGELDLAARELSEALEAMPDYAAAHATLAAVHLSQGEAELARTELETARRLDPDLHLLPAMWAGYYATTGDLDRAVASARDAVERNGGDVQTRLMAARVYRQAGRYADMRREARAILERVPASRRREMEEVLRRVLGSTALEEEEEEDDLDDEDWDDEEWDEDEGGGGSGGGLRLGTGGSRLLGGGGGGPSLLDPSERPTPPTGLQLGGGAAPGGGSLQLSEPGQ